MLHRTILGLAAVIGFALVGTQASALTRFGAKLDINTQPSNAGSGIFCDNGAHPLCSWVLMQAYQCEFGSCINGHRAPKDGIIASVRLIACFPGSFVLQLAHASASLKQARVVRSGPLINYKGDSQHCNGNTYQIETFPANVPVHTNDYLAVATQKLGFIRCSGGSFNMLKFIPPLADGAPLRTTTVGDGCFMLLEAIYK